MMSTDHDLLEKAAMVAGLQILRWWYDVAVLYDPRTHEEGATWNPLNDDGDALRLAVKLGIDIHFDRQRPNVYIDMRATYVNAIGDGCLVGATEQAAEDPVAATRRAIVRAAAALCDAKESGDA